MSTTVSLQIPRRAQSLVIGKGRAIITEIMSKTDTTVEIPPRRLQSSLVTITGDAQGVADAQEHIERILGYELDNVELTIAYFSVPKSEHPTIVGTNGVLLKDLRKKCGCHIHVPRLRDRERNIEVHGNAASIELAQKEVESMLGHTITVSLAGPVMNNQKAEGSAASSSTTSAPRKPAAKQPALINSETGKRRLDKGRINQVFFLPSSPEDDPFPRILECISNASVSVSFFVVSLDHQNLVVLVQNLLSQNVPVQIIVKNGFPGSNLTEVHTLQSLGAKVVFDKSSTQLAHNFALVDNALVISGTHTWTKAGSSTVRQSITMTNHRDFVRPFVLEFNKYFNAEL